MEWLVSWKLGISRFWSSRVEKDVIGGVCRAVYLPWKLSGLRSDAFKLVLPMIMKNNGKQFSILLFK